MIKTFYIISIAIIGLAASYQQLIRKDLEMAKINLLWAILLSIIYTAL